MELLNKCNDVTLSVYTKASVAKRRLINRGKEALKMRNSIDLLVMILIVAICAAGIVAMYLIFNKNKTQVSGTADAITTKTAKDAKDAFQ